MGFIAALAHPRVPTYRQYTCVEEMRREQRMKRERRRQKRNYFRKRNKKNDRERERKKEEREREREKGKKEKKREKSGYHPLQKREQVVYSLPKVITRRWRQLERYQRNQMVHQLEGQEEPVH